MKLYKGSCSVLARTSPTTLYNADIATFEEDDLYDQTDATGFLNIYGLPSKVEAMMRKK